MWYLMHILSLKPVLYSAVISITCVISLAAQIHIHYQHASAQLVKDQGFCVVNAAPCEIMHVMEITADYRTGFTDKMQIK